MEKSGDFVNVSPNQGTLHFCRLNISKKSPNRQYQKRKKEENGIKLNLKRRVKFNYKRVRSKKSLAEESSYFSEEIYIDN